MFRRDTSSPAPQTPAPTGDAAEKAGGKGRPTPSRKAAEAAARDRARMAFDKNARRKVAKEHRVTSMREMREAMKTGDEAHLPPRDKGPVKRFLRDLVDTRLGFAELFAPMLILILVITSFAPAMGSLLWGMSLLLVIADVIVIRFKARRGVARRFPDAGLKGVTYYAVMRSLNMRFLRLPKPQVKIGQPLPDRYR